MTCRFVSVVSVWGKPEWPMTPIPQVRTSNLQRRLCTRREPVSCASRAATRPFIVGAKLAEAERAGATGALGGASTHTHTPLARKRTGLEREELWWPTNHHHRHCLRRASTSITQSEGSRGSATSTFPGALFCLPCPRHDSGR